MCAPKKNANWLVKQSATLYFWRPNPKENWSTQHRNFWRMLPLQEFRIQVEKVVQALSCEELFQQQLENHLLLDLSDTLSSCLALKTREQGEELLDASILLWNRLVEYCQCYPFSNDRTFPETPPKKQSNDLPCVLIKVLHVATDAMCVALSSLQGMSGNFDIDWRK